MQPIGLSVAPDVEVAELLDRLDEATSTAPVPVVAADRLIGVVDVGQIQRYLLLRHELQVPLTAARPASV
jgi:hypothetical protein